MGRMVRWGGILAALMAGTGMPAFATEDNQSADVQDAVSASCDHVVGEVAYKAVCGTFSVPENRQDPDSRLIELPFKRILAQTETPDTPLFILNGGPGFSNMGIARLLTWFAGERDVIVLGYRGADGSVILACPEVGKAIKAGGELFSDQFITEMGDGFQACANRHEAEGVDLAGYTVLEVVDDIEALRTGLGFEQINLLSISYGTRVALLYGWRYPDSVSRSAMISVNPPGHFEYDPVQLETQIERYSDLCAKDDYCTSRTDDLAADMRAALDNMPERWLVFPVNRDAVVFSSYMALFSTSGAASVFDMWLAAADGDYSGMALVSLIYPFMLPQDIVWGDVAAKGLSTDFEAGNLPLLADEKTLLGGPGNFMGLAAAAGWPGRKIDEAYRVVRRSDVETLMLSGTLDVSTPYEAARDELLPFMPAAQQVVVSEFSHAADLVYAQANASEHLLTTFYRTGVVDASLYTDRPVNFDPGLMRFPLMAKGGLALILASLLLLTVLFRFVIQLVRR